MCCMFRLKNAALLPAAPLREDEGVPTEAPLIPTFSMESREACIYRISDPSVASITRKQESI